jgi:hypothetical protein
LTLSPPLTVRLLEFNCPNGVEVVADVVDREDAERQVAANSAGYRASVTMLPASAKAFDGRSRWRWTGLAAAIVVYLAAVLTFGLGFLLAPASVAISVVALKRLPPPRGWAPWLGLAANLVLLVPLVIWVLPSLLAGDY